VNTGNEFLSCLQNGIGAGRAVPAGLLKSARVDDQHAGHPVADRTVGVPVDDAVGLGKAIPETRFYVRAQVGSMGQGNGESGQGKAGLQGQSIPGQVVAAVAMDGMDRSISQGFQDTEVGEVAGMDDQVTVCEAVPDETLEAAIRAVKMGVGKDTCTYGHGSSLTPGGIKDWRNCKGEW
jgi:hypothetical protein